MNIKQKLRIFLSEEEQLTYLRNSDNVRYDDSVYSESVYNLSFIKEYQRYSLESKNIT